MHAALLLEVDAGQLKRTLAPFDQQPGELLMSLSGTDYADAAVIYASCLFVVTRGCPERGLSEVDPVLRSLSSKYSIVLTERLNLVATTDAETLLCSMPMARSLSVCVKRGIYSTA